MNIIIGACLTINLFVLTPKTNTASLNICGDTDKVKVVREYFSGELPKSEYKEMSASDLLNWGVFLDLPKDVKMTILNRLLK